MRLASYVTFEGLGGFQERFLTELFENKIKCWGIKNKQGYLYGKVYATNYFYVAKLAKKHGFRVKIIQKHGVYFRAYPYRKRWGLPVGLMLFALLLIFSSNHIWDIRVEGNTYVSEVRIREVLAQNGIMSGMPTGTSQYIPIKRKILLQLPELVWINLKTTGCRMIVEVTEQERDKGVVPLNQPANVISLKDAQIISSEVLDGKQLVQNGSAVKKGGIIVSGIMPDAEGNLYYKHARANVIGQFEEEKTLYIPYTDTVEVLGDKKSEKKYLVFLNNIIPMFFGNDEPDSFVYDESIEQADFMGISLPFDIKTGTYTEYEKKEITRTKDDTIALLKKQRADLEDNLYGEYEIVNVHEEFHPDEKGIMLKLHYTLRGNIAKSEEIFIRFKK